MTEYHYPHTPPTSCGSIVEMHLSMFGNTSRIISGITHHSFDKEMDKLERIQYMIRMNKDMISECNRLLSDRNSYVHLLGQQQKYRDKIRFYHAVRERLITYYNYQLNKMKI